MSLTRAEWVEMWKEIKRIEHQATCMRGNSDVKVKILENVRRIKAKIEDVIGQME